MKAPAFQFYPADFMSGNVATYSLDEIGLYTVLLAFDWSLNGLPTEPEKLAKLARISTRKFASLWKTVGENFTEQDGRYFNPRLQLEREKQATNRQKKVDAAHSRWNANADAPALQTQCSPSSTTSSSASALQNVDDEGRGCSAVELAVFCNAAITERWGEQPSPITHGQCGSLAEYLAGVHWETVRDAIAHQCRTSKADRPPRSPNYFRPGIEQFRDERAAKANAAAHGPLPRVIIPAPPSDFERLREWAIAEDARIAKEKANVA